MEVIGDISASTCGTGVVGKAIEVIGVSISLYMRVGVVVGVVGIILGTIWLST